MVCDATLYETKLCEHDKKKILLYFTYTDLLSIKKIQKVHSNILLLIVENFGYMSINFKYREFFL